MPANAQPEAVDVDAEDLEQLSTEGARLRAENAALRDAIEVKSLRKENASLKNVFKRDAASRRASRTQP
jgi:cell shape-determining protein MreC